MPRIFTLVSIAIHAIVIALVLAAQIFDIGPLPLVREALAFHERLVTLKEIPLLPPPPPQRTSAASPRVEPTGFAPIEAPIGVKPETPVAPPETSGVPGGVNIAEAVGGDALIGVVRGTTAPPPPPPPERRAPTPLHQGIQPPRKMVDVQPTYPPLARSVHQAGIVILETIIDATGAVENVRVLRGFPLLDQAAVDAVRQWRFTPALLNGQPIPVVMTVTVNFELR